MRSSGRCPDGRLLLEPMPAVENPDPRSESLRELGAPPADDFTRTRADLERWRGGDPKAFDDLWKRYRPALEILILGKIRSALEPELRPKLDADDVLQEVALAVFSSLREFEYRGPGSMLAWMKRIATCTLQDWADYWRAGKRRPSLERPLAGAGGTSTTGSGLGRMEPPDGGSGISTAIDRSERRRRLAAAMADLSERHHTIVLWRFYAGASWAEIAAEVGAPSGDAVRVEAYAKAFPALARLLSAGRPGVAGHGDQPPDRLDVVGPREEVEGAQPLEPPAEAPEPPDVAGEGRRGDVVR